MRAWRQPGRESRIQTTATGKRGLTSRWLAQKTSTSFAPARRGASSPCPPRVPDYCNPAQMPKHRAPEPAAEHLEKHRGSRGVGEMAMAGHDALLD